MEEEATIWSPHSQILNSAAMKLAACPEEVSIAAVPPSHWVSKLGCYMVAGGILKTGVKIAPQPQGRKAFHILAGVVFECC